MVEIGNFTPGWLLRCAISSAWRTLVDWTRRHATLYLYIVGLAGVLVAGTQAFSDLGGSVFFSWDSSSLVAFANESLRNNVPLSLGPSYSQSLGNITHAIDFWLIPEAALSFRDGHIDPELFYLVVAGLYFSCAFLTAVIFDFGRWLAFVAALTFTLVVLPYASPPVLTEIFWWHGTFLIPYVYLTWVIFISYYIIGRLDGWRNMLPVAFLILGVFWIVAGYPKMSVVLLLGASVLCLVLTVASQTRSEVVWKLGGGGLAALAFFSSDAWLFLRGVYGHTGNFIYVSTLDSTGQVDIGGAIRSLLHPPSLWLTYFSGNLVWVKYYMGYWLPGLALLGAGWTLVSPIWPRAAKLLAVCLIAILAFSFTSIYGSIHPTQIYYFLFILALVPPADLMLRMGRRLSWSTSPRLDRLARFAVPGGAVTIVLVICVAVASLPRSKPGGYPYPPSDQGLAAFLRTNLGFGQADRFRGRYLNLLLTEVLDEGALNPISNTTAMAVSVIGVRLAAGEGNDLTYAGPRFHEVPATIEYNRMSTPLSMVFHNYLLVRDGDMERLDYRTITRFDPRLLSLIGVRYVLASQTPDGPGARVVSAAPLSSRSDVRLYEISDPNLGQYAPKRLSRVASVRESLLRLREPDFDPRREALVYGPVPKRSLVAPTSVVIERVRNGLRVEASSDGWTYLVLPFEFSRCLVVEASGGKAPALVGRANLILTGVLFEREARFDLRFSFGPFGNADCRLQDVEDTRTLELSLKTLEQMRPGYKTRLRFEGLQ